MYLLKKKLKFCPKAIVLLAINIIVQSTYAQHSIPLNDEFNLRYEKLNYNDPNIHTTFRPFRITKPLSNSDFSIVLKDSSKVNSRYNSHSFELTVNDFSMYLSPIVNLSPGYEMESKTFLNNYQLGLMTGGQFTKKLAWHFDGFYGIQSFDKSESILADSFDVLPHFKQYDAKKGGNYHYYDISGYLSYSPYNYLNLQAGIGKNFLGDGYRSLFLSDNSGSYPFLKAIAKIWKFEYLWMIGFLNDVNTNIQENNYHNKMVFTHCLSWNATKWLNLNFFESSVANPVDSMGVTYFNINYLNPVIFFRPVEFQGGSADNSLLGLGGTITLWKKYKFYGQFLVDEFVFSEMTSNAGWWGNKFGIQAGLKIFDLFNVKNLFVRGEYNMVMPYSYSYSNSIQNYGHYRQTLAHPLGANFEELLFQAHYHKNRFSAELKASYYKTGIDNDSTSYGQDIYKPYTYRQGDYGNHLGQGFSVSGKNIVLKTSWIVNTKKRRLLFLSLNYSQISNMTSPRIYTSFGFKSLLFNDEPSI